MTEDVLVRLLSFGESLRGHQMVLGKSGFPFGVLSLVNKNIRSELKQKLEDTFIRVKL